MPSKVFFTWHPLILGIMDYPATFFKYKKVQPKQVALSLFSYN